MPHMPVSPDRFHLGAADEVLARTRHELLPLARQQPGFVAYDLVPDARRLGYLPPHLRNAAAGTGDRLGRDRMGAGEPGRPDRGG